MTRKITIEEKKLIRRYLIWSYKTTKEELDRIDRKFTQLKVDGYILKQLLQWQNNIKHISRASYKKNIDAFKQYISKKEKEAYRLKFFGQGRTRPNSNYVYFKNRLAAIQKSIISFLGKKELKFIKSLYEEEMTRRILEAREHT